MHWIGMDVSKATLDMALTDDQGTIIDERKIDNTARAPQMAQVFGAGGLSAGGPVTCA